MATSPIRVGFILRSFTYGGAEHDVIQLITQSDRSRVRVVGMVVQEAFPLCPDLSLDDPTTPVIYHPGSPHQHPGIISNCSFPTAVARVAAQSDVLIAWGVPDLDDAIPQSFRGSIVVTSKASGSFQESFLYRNALLTGHYVANSVKSIEGFPPRVHDQVEVIYTGVDPRRLAQTRSRDEVRQEWGLTPEDRVIGFLGRIAHDKGVERVVEAVRGLDSQWKAVFVGRTGNFSDYEQQFEELCRTRIPDQHRVVDWRTDIGNVLHAMDVMVYPSDEEGFANSLAEAWLAGVPTVATAGVGALAEAPWCDCSVAVPPQCSPSELRTAICTAFGNEALVRTARETAASFTVEMTVDAWQDYLERIVRGPRRTRVMALLPDLSIGGMQSWLLTLMRHTPNVDWVCLGVVSELDAFEGDPPLIDEFLNEGCPVIGIPNLPDAEVRRRLERAMRQTRPDVVIQAGVRNLDRRYPECRVPLVTVSHGSSSSEWGVDVLSNSCHCASRYVAVSETAADAFNETHRSRVETIPNGVEPPPSPEVRAEMRTEARKELGLKPNQIAVGYLGRLSPEKNPTTVARAVAELPDDYQAIFVGPPKPGMLDEIRNIIDRFRHVPGVRPAETGQWLAAMDVLVCPSEFESFGLAIVEAWTFGVPVVATPVGVVEELQGDADVAVTVSLTAAPADWADAIQRALRERTQRSERCQRLARQRFDAACMGRQWETLLQSLAEGEAADFLDGIPHIPTAPDRDMEPWEDDVRPRT